MENDDKAYLEKLYDNLERCIEQGKPLFFKVVRLHEKGLVTKIGGLFSFVPFHRMPWKYRKLKGAWQAVFPAIMGKQFFCKIERIDRATKKIYLDASVHLFSSYSLVVGMDYTCIVLRNAKSGCVVDIGVHFDWKHGSILAELSRSAINRNDIDESALEPGKTLTLRYFGQSPADKPIVGDHAIAAFRNENTAELMGKTVPVQVIKDKRTGIKCYKALGKFKGILPVGLHRHPDIDKNAVLAALNSLPDRAVIGCEVVETDTAMHSLVLRWVVSYIGGPAPDEA